MFKKLSVIIFCNVETLVNWFGNKNDFFFTETSSPLDFFFLQTLKVFFFTVVTNWYSLSEILLFFFVETFLWKGISYVGRSLEEYKSIDYLSAVNFHRIFFSVSIRKNNFLNVTIIFLFSLWKRGFSTTCRNFLKIFCASIFIF